MNASTRVKVALLLVSGLVSCSESAIGAPYTYTTLDDPSAVHGTAALGVSGNNVVGWYYGAGFTAQGFLYDGSSYKTLTYPYPLGVSGNEIVGYYTTSKPHGFLYDGTTYKTLDDPLGAYGTFASGVDQSTIVGWYDDSQGKSHGFVYDGSSYKTIDVGTSETWCRGVYGSNIVGSYRGSDGYHGFLYDGQSFTFLNDPAGTNTQADGICEGNIVGIFHNSSGKTVGFLYNGSTYTTLDNPLGVLATEPYSISGNRIVGYYQDASNVSHGFSVAVPEPSPLALISMGVVFLLGYRKWLR
jgi:hypothetical protein